MSLPSDYSLCTMLCVEYVQSENQQVLQELAKMCLLADLTLILAWR